MPLVAGVEGAADATGLVATGVDATGLDSTGLEAAALDALGTAVALDGVDPTVVRVVGMIGIADAVDEFVKGAVVEATAEVVTKIPPTLGVAPIPLVVVEDGRTTPGLVDGMVTELAIVGTALACSVEEVTGTKD